MKKFLLLSFVCICFAGYAQEDKDPVIMTVAGKDIHLSEFVFIAEKNGEVNLKDKKSVTNYVDLFKKFKLKVAEAESLGMDQTVEFKQEFEEYRSQLTAGYLSDKDAEERVMRSVYDRGEEMLEISHILFRLPAKTVSKDTVAVYENAKDTYDRIQRGEDFSIVGKELSQRDQEHITYEYVGYFLPMQTLKTFENVAYSLPVGGVSLPVRTKLGFHLILVHSRKKNPGRAKVAHVLVKLSENADEEESKAALKQAEDICNRARQGDDFASLAKQYSADPGTASQGGELPLFGPGEMVKEFEDAAFALTTPGEISGPIKTRFGYHIIKLIERMDRPTFDEIRRRYSAIMSQGERNFELYASFDDRLKQEYGYVFYPEAYNELQQLCDDYFPTDDAFFEKAKDLTAPVIHLDNTDILQNEFVDYMHRCPFSSKTYSGDFMKEVFDLFIRDIVTTAERKNLTTKHPEFSHLLQEYRDGILLFEISNKVVWSKPATEQPELESAWLKELNKKYPVEVNWKVLKKVMK